MKRRDFIRVVGGMALAWPLAAHAQQPAIQVIGVLSTRSSKEDAGFFAAFNEGLREAGFIEGRNIAMVNRWAEDHYDRLPALAADLVQRQVAVIVVTGAGAAALAAKAETATIPIVFLIGGNPVELGLVRSLNRPGGNITGITNINAELDPKRLGLLAELSPDVTTVAFLVNPDSPTTAEKIERLQAAASALQRKIDVVNARIESDIDDAFAVVAQRRIRALVITGDNFLNAQSRKIAALASRYAVPAIGVVRDLPASGGLMSYGPQTSEVLRQVALYTARILKGEKPADLPVLQPTKFELMINLKTAKALGLTIPPGVLAIIDEVIE